MGEALGDVMHSASEVMYWLGKYTVANACALVARLCRARDLRTLDELEAFVVEVEVEGGLRVRP